MHFLSQAPLMITVDLSVMIFVLGSFLIEAVLILSQPSTASFQGSEKWQADHDKSSGNGDCRIFPT